MKIKIYECTSCHFKKEMELGKSLMVNCPECGSKSCRVRYSPKNDIKSEFANICYDDNERWSIAMGVPAHQVDEFRRRFPNSTYRDDGALLVKNRPDKLRQIRERGFIEHN